MSQISRRTLIKASAATAAAAAVAAPGPVLLLQK